MHPDSGRASGLGGCIRTQAMQPGLRPRHPASGPWFRGRAVASVLRPSLLGCGRRIRPPVQTFGLRPRHPGLVGGLLSFLQGSFG